MINNPASPLQKWVPYKFFQFGRETLCHWLYVDEKEFSEPFFEDTIGKCLSFEINSKQKRCASDFSFMKEWAKNLDSVDPSAFIFHVSRCGSTMVSQLLTMSKSHIVLSEVPFFDDVLRMPFKKEFPATPDQNLLKYAIPFYTQKRRGNESYAFIKLDSWHIFFHRQIRELYPGTPFILIYRSPEEVIRSLRKKPGMQSVPGLIEPEVLGISDEEIGNVDFYAYAVKVIDKYMTAFIDIAQRDKNSFLVNYKEGMLPIVQKICKITGAAFIEEAWERMKQRIQYNGKYPEQKFREDAIEETISGDLQHLFHLYNDLERTRNSEDTFI